MKEDTIFENNTQMNEETILENNSQMGESTILEEDTETRETMEAGKKQSNGKTWATVALGGTSGILLGAGLLYAQKVYGKTHEQPQPEPHSTDPEDKPEFQTGTENESKPADNQQQETHNNVNEVHHHHTQEVHHVHHVHDASNNPSGLNVGGDLSFEEAFAEARAEVGPGGVFVWHGGVYSTFTTEEWNAMTPEEQQEFLDSVGTAVPVDRIDQLPTAGNPEPWGAPYDGPDPDDGEDYTINWGEKVDDQTADNFDLGPDVHVVGFGKDSDAHLVAAYDHNEDGSVDFAIVDVDDNHEISDPDIRIDTEGNVERVDEYLARVSGEDVEKIDEPVVDDGADYTSDDTADNNGGGDDPSLHYTSNEYDPSSDMPDYMDDVVMDA